MTQQERREAIKKRAEERRERTARGYATYWLTRDTWNGKLSDYVEVWLVRPERKEHSGDVFWKRPGGEPGETVFARWTLDEARAEVRSGIPDNDRECLRVGPEPVA